MSRKRFAEAVTKLPVPATAQVIDTDPPPILLVVRLQDVASVDQMNAIRDGIHLAFEGKPHPPIVVTDPRITIEAVLDPRGSPCKSPATANPSPSCAPAPRT